MSTLEQKAVRAILDRIRARRKLDSPLESPFVRRPRATVPAQLREADWSDFENITELKRRGGIVVDPIENWERLWWRNPALQQVKSPAIGWVLEAQGKIVGYLGNIPLLYRYGSRTLAAVTGTGFVVDPEYRAASLTLDSAFYRQKSVDLHLATTAIEAVGKLAIAFRSSALPQPEYDSVLFWVLRSYPFAKALVKKLDSPLPGVGAVLASLAVQSDVLLRRRRPDQCSAEFGIREIRVNEIGDEFQAFWCDKLKEGLRLYADRSAAMLRWHFEIPGQKGTTRILACYRRGDLAGYAVIRNEMERRNGLRRTLMADLMARQDDAEVVRALFVAAFEHARLAESDILEVVGFPQNVRRILSESKPYVRKLPACPFYYRANDPLMHAALADSSAWYACAYDGDATLMP